MVAPFLVQSSFYSTIMPLPRDFRNPDMNSKDISFELQRLFDPFNLDHIPEEKRMKRFRQRNMAHVRHYKAAVKFFGAPHSRRRILIAPSMETPMRHRTGEYMNKVLYPDPPILSTDMKPAEGDVAFPRETPQWLVDSQVETDTIEEHQKWIKERQQLRSDLNNMGLTQAYLERKPDKSPQEKALMQKMIEDSKPVLPSPKQTPESHLSPDPGKAIPTVKLPSPKALMILEHFMQEKKIRLLDLFTAVDKDKNWTISRDEFMKAMKIHKVPLTEELAEDLVLALDTDCSDELDYRELSKGMDRFRRERRENKRKDMDQHLDLTLSSLSRTPSFGSRQGRKQNLRSGKSSPALFHFEAKNSPADMCKTYGSPQHESSRVTTPEFSPREHIVTPFDKTTLSKVQEVPSSVSTTEKPKSAGKSSSNSCASTPTQLALPEPDLRPEQFVLGSDEAMVDHIKVTRSILTASAKGRKAKSDRDIRYPSVIKIGDKAIDNHSMFSQLDGDSGELMNRFRQEKLREYYAVRALCQERGVNLTKELLDKVLLHPPDKPHNVILREIKRRPCQRLLPSTFANPPKNSEDPPEEKMTNKEKKAKKTRTSDGKIGLPKQKWIASRGKRVNLSTGRAFIRPASDTWLSFEQYEELTRHLSAKYKRIHGPVNYNAFWPGFLLDRLHLCMPPYDTSHQGRIGSSVLFQNVKQGQKSNYGYNNDLNSYPLDSQGCVKYGDIDPYIRKPLVL
ncbi:EF-hand calcium-binding domain-containing protein 12-like isoform X2 [Liolophura sinensis]|uniref:EF-hand calcium-binding domain-containing protein 12-like isoform X2 n=1 Tax=Liolophura sinensis TaxID=3198878 RepID=UPI003158AB9E